MCWPIDTCHMICSLGTHQYITDAVNQVSSTYSQFTLHSLTQFTSSQFSSVTDAWVKHFLGHHPLGTALGIVAHCSQVRATPCKLMPCPHTFVTLGCLFNHLRNRHPTNVSDCCVLLPATSGHFVEPASPEAAPISGHVAYLLLPLRQVICAHACRENLFYAASLKLDPRVEGRRKQMLIEEALAMLSLLKKKDAVVGSVEKKASSCWPCTAQLASWHIVTAGVCASVAIIILAAGHQRRGTEAGEHRNRAGGDAILAVPGRADVRPGLYQLDDSPVVSTMGLPWIERPSPPHTQLLDRIARVVGRLTPLCIAQGFGGADEAGHEHRHGHPPAAINHLPPL
jgi:hypothetical protein